MKNKLAIAALAVLAFAAIAVSACTRAPTDGALYFPLKAGMAWTFRFSESGGATGQLTTTNLAPRKLYGLAVFPQQTSGGEKTYTEFYVDDGSGIRHAAIDEGEGLQSRMNDHSYVIKLPIKVGTSWREIGRTFDGTIYDATTRIESVSDKVSVPAGTFSGCVRVKSTGTASPVRGIAGVPWGGGGLSMIASGDVSVEEYYWLAPGVGPVKATHQETQGEGPMAQSVAFTLELEHLKQ